MIEKQEQQCLDEVRQILLENRSIMFTKNHYYMDTVKKIQAKLQDRKEKKEKHQFFFDNIAINDLKLCVTDVQVFFIFFVFLAIYNFKNKNKNSVVIALFVQPWLWFLLIFFCISN